MKKYLKYVKCYGGYVLAVGAGCTFGTSLVAGTALLVAAAYMANNCCGTCCKL
tara:strand:- start:1289 stop:1447 length:159 start_codon:yes stop_codon:yes gene_type:complete